MNVSSKITYRQQYTRCGKQRCRKCREGSGHGPYWYAYWSEKGRTVSKYIGSTLPEQIATSQQLLVGEQDEQATIPIEPSLPTPVLRIYLLGQFRVEHLKNGSWQVTDSRTWHRRRARSLLGCLLSNSGRRIGREQVMEMLWPDLDIDVAANRLNGAVHELRQILEPGLERPAASRLLRLERDILELADKTEIWVDAEEFEARLKEAEQATNSSEAERLLEEAAQLYRGSYLLEELYSEWAARRRDALHRAWVGLQLKLAQIRAEQGSYVSAIETLDRLRSADPTNETALQRLMLLLTQLDRRGEALQMYRQYESMLTREYEGEPLPETQELYEKLRRGHVPTLPESVLPAQKADEPPAHGTPAPSAPHPPLPTQVDLLFTRPVFQIGRHNQSPLIGREAELDTIHNILLQIEGADPHEDKIQQNRDPGHAKTPPSRSAQAPSPRSPHFLLLKGDSGIGKTRLAEEFSLEAYNRGWTVAWSRSYEQEGAIPYRPWTELLRTLLQSASTFEELVTMTTSVEAFPTTAGTKNLQTGREPLLTSAQSSPPGQRKAPLKLERLSALLPEFTSVPPSISVPPPSIPHEQERLHLWEATLGLLSALSKIHPLLLVFDDLQWADESSLDLLTYLTHHLQQQRILLVGTCREGELAPQHKLRALTAELQREQAITLIPVQPLSNAEISTLVAHLPQEMIQNIQTQASGNPFFAEELARYVDTLSTEEKTPESVVSARKTGPLDSHTQVSNTATQSKRSASHSANQLPGAIAAVLERRLNRLSSDCQALLGKAAVLGGFFELQQLLPMAPEYDEDTVLDLLDEALQAGLLTEEGTGAHIIYHFWHPLIISHLYGRLSAARRAQLHRRAAEALKAATTTHPEKVAAAIVYHLIRGGGSAETLGFYARLAGNQAYAMAAYTESQRYFVLVIQTLLQPEQPVVELSDIHESIALITSQPLSQRQLADPLILGHLLEYVAECSMIRGDFADARGLYEALLELRASESFRQHEYGTSQLNEQQSEREVQIQAILLRAIGLTWAFVGEYEQSHAYYAHGMRVLTDAKLTHTPAWACLIMRYGANLRLEGKYAEARSLLHEALSILKHSVQPSTERLTRIERALIGDPLDMGEAYEGLGVVAASLAQLTDGLAHMHTALAIYEQHELITEMARVCGNLGATYIMKGEHEAARQYLQRALELTERIGHLPYMASAMINLGSVEQRSGNLLEAEDWAKQGRELSARMQDREHASYCSWTLATVQTELGKFGEAAASIAYALKLGRSLKNMPCIHYALTGLADLRITQAIADDPQLAGMRPTPPEAFSLRTKHLLHRSRFTLERILAVEGIEVDTIIDAKHLLAFVHYFLGNVITAQQLAEETLRQARTHETIRSIARTYRLLGCIFGGQGAYEQAEEYFQQALHISKDRGLRLDYARTLYNYGALLVQMVQEEGPTTSTSVEKQRKQRGLNYLQEAIAIASDCDAVIDRRIAEYLLEQAVETRG